MSPTISMSPTRFLNPVQALRPSYSSFKKPSTRTDPWSIGLAPGPSSTPPSAHSLRSVSRCSVSRSLSLVSPFPPFPHHQTAELALRHQRHQRIQLYRTHSLRRRTSANSEYPLGSRQPHQGLRQMSLQSATPTPPSVSLLTARRPASHPYRSPATRVVSLVKKVPCRVGHHPQYGFRCGVTNPSEHSCLDRYVQ